MKGDFTRFTHDPTKHYTGVLKQQGRVDLDVDWNELVAIDAHLRETTNRDVIGHCGIPKYGGGFRIDFVDDTEQDLTISPGRIYVDGILCELEEPKEPDPRITYLHQPDYPNPSELKSTGRTDLVYLDVWKRHITALEDPEIREKALGGPDTTTRIKTVWQVKILAGADCEAFKQDHFGHYVPPLILPLNERGCLSTGTDPAGTDEPCIIAPGGGYQGLENRLYRVEIHEGGGSGKATFKWSRDNGSVVFAIVSFGVDNTVTVKQIGKDEVLALRVGDWVEVLDDETELHNVPGIMAQISAEGTDLANRIVKLSEDLSEIKDPKNPKLRRWDQLSDVISIDTTRKYELEDGIWIQFSISNGHQFYPGDYWVFAARAATGQVDELVNAEPRGIEHHYCALAMITWGADTSPSRPTIITDCTPTFPPLTELPTGGASCCTVTVGDGKHSFGNYQSIRQAINELPSDGPARVCILPGEHRLDNNPVTIECRNWPLTISGCGRQTQIISSDSAFIVKGGSETSIECLYVLSLNASPAFQVDQSDHFRLTDCVIENKSGPAIVVSGGKGVVIAHNRMMNGGVLIGQGAIDIRIVDNLIHGGAGPGIVLGGSTRVAIIGNQIRDKGGSGISTVVIDNQSEASVNDVTIANNRIVYCASAQQSGEVAVGGIVLHNVSNLRIHGNHLEGIGGDQNPGCGVFVRSYAGRLDISDNTIIRNASDGPEEQVYQVGIAALRVPEQYSATVRIHNNHVECPKGQALMVLGAGPMSVTNNTLVSGGPWKQPPLDTDKYPDIDAILRLGKCVTIANQGQDPTHPDDKFTIEGSKFGLEGLDNGNAKIEAVTSVVDGRVMVHDNQITSGGLNEKPYCSTAIVSFDDVSFQGNQVIAEAKYNGGATGANVVIRAPMIRASMNRFREPGESQAMHSLHASGNHGIVTNNQANHCLDVGGLGENIKEHNKELAGC